MSKKNSSVNLKNGFKNYKDLSEIFLNFKNKLNNQALSINNSKIDWYEIVKWPKGSYQDLHLDTASSKTSLSSIHI